MVHLPDAFWAYHGAGAGVNTAVEAVVDLVTEERKPLAKIAKDTAAGAVLIAAIMATIAGIIIFLPKGLTFLGL